MKTIAKGLQLDTVLEKPFDETTQYLMTSEQMYEQQNTEGIDHEAEECTDRCEGH